MVGLYRTSCPVQKSGKLIKSWLSGNGTFSLPDRTESRLIFLKFYLTSMSHQCSYDKVHWHKFGVKKSWIGVCIFENRQSFRTVRILKICWTSGPDMMSGRALRERKSEKIWGNFFFSKSHPQCIGKKRKQFIRVHTVTNNLKSRKPWLITCLMFMEMKKWHILG